MRICADPKSRESLNKWKKKIKKYKEQCEPFRRELQLAIKRNHDQCLNTYYAVDFSEIYAFLFPNKTASEFRLFVDEEFSVLNTLQSQALTRMFFGRQKPILLHPYAVEWNSTFSKIHNHAVNKTLDLATKISNEIQELSKDPEVKRILGQYEKNKNLTSKECQRLLKFLEEKSSVLLESVKEKDSDYPKRLQRIVGKDVFLDLSDLKDLLEDSYPFELDVVKIKDYYNRLLKIRNPHDSDQDYASPIPSAEIDAIAIFIIEKVNLVLENKNARLLLITRSNAMHKLMDELRGKDQSLLCHPRAFTDFFFGDGDEDSSTQRAQNLRQYLKTIDVFYQAVQDFVSQDYTALENTENSSTTQMQFEETWSELEKKFSQVKEIWKNWTEYTAISNIALQSSESGREATSRSNTNTVYRVLALFQDKNLRKYLQAEIESLAEDWKRVHQSLGVVLQGSITENPIELMSVTNPAKSKHEIQTRSKYHFYYVHVYSEEAKKILERLEEPETEINWLELLSSFSEPKKVNTEAAYERLLVMAFILGTFNQWRLAELYCDLAIDKSQESKKGTISNEEALYFKAVCIRKQVQSASDHRGAIEELEKAIQQRGKNKKNGKSSRYFQEYGLQILMLNIRTSMGEGSDRNDPDSNEGFRMLEEAERILDELPKADREEHKNRKLKIKIYNDRLYFYTRTERLSDRATLKRFCDRLERLQQGLSENPQDWSPLILDTIIWVRWNLKETDDETWENYFDILKRSLEGNLDLLKREIREIRNHIKIIEEELET